MSESELTPAERQERGYRLEREAATLLNARLTPGSGSKTQKGDLRLEEADGTGWLLECKFRAYQDESGGQDATDWYVPLDLDWIETLCHHTRKLDRRPALLLEWGDGTRGVLLTESDYIRLNGLPLNTCFCAEITGRTTGRLFTRDVGDIPLSLGLLGLEDTPERHWVLVSLAWFATHVRVTPQPQRAALPRPVRTGWPSRPRTRTWRDSR